VSAIAAGEQRLEVRIQGTAGDWWQRTVNYDVPRAAGDPSLLWDFSLPGSIQGGVTLVDAQRGLLATASTKGDVVLFDTRGTLLWRDRVGAADFWCRVLIITCTPWTAEPDAGCGATTPARRY
jgi:hypothetical protein